MKRERRSGSSLFAAVGLAWLMGVVVYLAVIGGLIYAAVHFISKFW